MSDARIHAKACIWSPVARGSDLRARQPRVVAQAIRVEGDSRRPVSAVCGPARARPTLWRDLYRLCFGDRTERVEPVAKVDEQSAVDRPKVDAQLVDCQTD